MSHNQFRIVITPPKSDGFHTINDEHQAEIVQRRITEALKDARVDADVRKVRHIPAPSRFHSRPAEVDAFLREHFAEDVLLRYQWAVGDRAAEEAAREIRMETNKQRADGVLEMDRFRPCRDAADQIDPRKGGGHYPSTLVSFPTPREA